MAETDAPISSLPIKSLTGGFTYVIGNVIITGGAEFTGPDLRNLVQMQKMYDSIVQQSLNVIQHTFDEDHAKGDCLAEAYGLGGTVEAPKPEDELNDLLLKAEGLTPQ